MPRSRGYPGLTAAAGCSGAAQELLAFMKPICPGSMAALEWCPLWSQSTAQEPVVPSPCHCRWYPQSQSAITTSCALGTGVTGHYPVPTSVSGVIFVKQFPQPPTALQAAIAMLSHCHLYTLRNYCKMAISSLWGLFSGHNASVETFIQENLLNIHKNSESQ